MFFSNNQGGQGKEENVRYISKAQSMDAAWLKRQGLANNYLQLRSEGKIQVSDDSNTSHQSYGGSLVVPRSIMTNPSAMRRLADEMGVDFLKAVQQGKIEFEAFLVCPAKQRFPTSGRHSLPQRTDEQCKILWESGERQLPGLTKSAAVIADMAMENEKHLGALSSIIVLTK
jgi:hypothetical protein